MKLGIFTPAGPLLKISGQIDPQSVLNSLSLIKYGLELWSPLLYQTLTT